MADYEGLVKCLARHLGSIDLAREALHDVFLRANRVSETEPLRSPKGYIVRAAINAVKDHRKRHGRLLNAHEIEAIVQIPEDRPDPFAVVADRLEFEKFTSAFAELPERSRRVFAAAHIHRQSHEEIARQLEISPRTVAFDLQSSMEHFRRRLGRKIVRRFGPRSKTTPQD